MSAAEIATLIDAGLRAFAAAKEAIAQAKPTLAATELQPLRDQLEQLHAGSLALGAELDAALRDAAQRG